MTNSSLGKALRRNLPLFSRGVRWAWAHRDSLAQIRSTYSQNGEDRTVREALESYDLKSGIYVDVGANQPSKISNTYLFYRLGCQGVLIEPNHELIRLLRRFRPRDIAIPVGCGERPALMEFRHSNASVFGTFTNDVIEGQRASEYLPILPLDLILEPIACQWIFFLSIDVEGLDLEVLRGATTALAKTLFLSIEYKSERSGMIDFLSKHSFVPFEETEHNLIFRSSNDFSAFQVPSGGGPQSQHSAPVRTP